MTLVAGPGRSAATIAERLRAAADSVTPFTVGVEEEYLLVGLDGPSLVDRAALIAAGADRDPRFRRELPPCQIEMATPPRSSTREVEAELRAARQAVARWCTGRARPMAAAVHPAEATFAAADTPRGAELVARYGWLARSQVLGSLQVHVAVGSADRLVAVHDELRAHLPHLAGLAAAAPFGEGVDREMASIRPIIASMLPRQGTPPPLGSVDAYAAELGWGADSGALDDPTQWWWELRPHPRHGTLEVRVADAQPRVEDSMAVVEVVVALVRWLAARADAGDLPPPAATWRIEENRWAAAISGLAGTFTDVRTGRRRAADAVLGSLLDEVAPWSERGLTRARRLIEDPSYRRILAWGPGDAVDGLAGAFAG